MKTLMAMSVALGALMLAGTAQAEIKIGVIAPITGPSAAFGAQIRNGAVQAVEDINKAGGVNGEKLVVSVGDDASDPKQGVSVANKFAGEGVKMVVGDFNSSVSIPVSEALIEAGIIQITPASTAIKFTERGNWNTFRTCGRDDQQGAVAAAYLADKFKGKKIAFIHDKSTYGKGLAEETLKALKAKGGVRCDLREPHARREGFFRPRLEAQTGQCRCDLLRRLLHRGRAADPPDARPGPPGSPHGRRCPRRP